ncbi:hypothetical protein AX016_2151 [Cellulophaga sp. RHA19]|nr:hypothetical protein AX016_2151 [Cellulophaga sp. RHA19]
MIYITLITVAAITIGLLSKNKPAMRAIKVPVRNKHIKK